MGHYIDGFVIPVPRKKMAAYRRMAQRGAKIWRDHGALDYKECVGDDLKVHCGLPFPRGIKTRAGETVVFSFIVYKSRSHRDSVNKKVMADPRINELCDMKGMPFDCERMLYGGFKTIVEM